MTACSFKKCVGVCVFYTLQIIHTLWKAPVFNKGCWQLFCSTHFHQLEHDVGVRNASEGHLPFSLKVTQRSSHTRLHWLVLKEQSNVQSNSIQLF